MKRKSCLSLTLALLITLSGAAQVKPFQFGFKVAPSLGWMASNIDEYEPEGSHPGFGWGFVTDFALTDNYFVSTGFNVDYSNSKMSYEDRQTVDTITYDGTMYRKYKLTQLEVPLTLKMKTNEFGPFRFFGQIGLGTSFNIKAKSKDKFVRVVDNAIQLSDQDDIKDNIRFLRSSLIIGLGAEFIIDGNTFAFLSVHFNNGLSNSLKGDNVVHPDVEPKGMLNFFQVNVGVMF